MALNTIHSFVYSSVNHQLKWDDVTDAISVHDGSGAMVVLPDLTSVELGFDDGQLLVQTCRGNDRVTITGQLTYPFASVGVDVNSPLCTPPPVCDLVIASVVPSHETEQGLHDGSVSIVATTSYSPVTFSLDGINWQASGNFFDLIPGNYTAYVMTFAGCQRSQSFTINPGTPATPEVDYPSLDRPCHFFELEYNGTVYEDLAEPAKWDNVNFVGKRDREWHGYRGMWSDGVIELEFDCPAGKEVLETAYNTDGNDAEVFFRYGYTYKGNKYVLFPGKVNFNTYKNHPQKVAASVEKADFNQSLLTRMDTKVSMSATEGLDGAPITPPAIVQTMLHAKEIVRNVKIQNTDPFNFGNYELRAQDFFIHPDTTAATLAEIEEFYPYPVNISVNDPVTFDEYDLNLKYAGTYDLTVEWNLDLTFFLKTVVGGTTTYNIRTFLQINNTQIEIAPPKNGTANLLSQGPKTVNISGSYTLNGQQLSRNDKIYTYAIMHLGRRETIISQLKQNSVNITVQSLERTAPTLCNAWLIHDVVNHCTRVITNGEAQVKSTFLSTQSAQQAIDGEGSLYLSTNGRQIRRFDVDKSPLKIALKDVLGSLKSIFCLGYSIERKTGKDVVRIERANYFYRNKQIIVIEECAEYREEVAKDMIYNTIDIGYEKYQDSGFNTLDEFNTKHEYLTPIKTNKLPLSIKSNLIASGYSIEDSRRQQFAVSATDSYQNDEDGFIISVRRESGGFVPETDEAFSKVENLISPSTAYNLRLSPLRMLLNWAIWLKGVFFYKAETEKIKNTFVVQNGELVTQFEASEPNPVGDINKLEWPENDDITLSNYDVTENLYRPEYIFFKCRLTPDRIQYIDRCMRGADKTNSYGYIVVKDSDGLYQGGYLLDMEYNYAYERASFKLLKKWDSPVVPGADCCDHLVVNGCYIKINDNKIIV